MADCYYKNYGVNPGTARCWTGGLRRVKAPRYRTISHKSYVDESLFGNSNDQEVTYNEWKPNFIVTQYTPSHLHPVSIECLAHGMRCRSISHLGKQQQGWQAVTARQVVRKLIVPSEPSMTESTILPREAFCRILEASGHSRVGADCRVPALGDCQTRAAV